MDNNNKNDLKKFFIKLAAVTFATIITFNIIFNLIFSERLAVIDTIIALDQKDNRVDLANKLRNEIRKGLNKENILSQEDKILLYNLYKKIKNELMQTEKIAN